MSISDIEGKTLYIKENNVLTPFIVADCKYRNDAVLLIRKNVLPSPMRFNEYSSYYENSEIDRYLSDTYIKTLNINTAHLTPVTIDITADSALGLTGKDIIQIDRYAFLLSYTELGFSVSPTVAPEGKPVSYFKKAQNRLACDLMGKPQSYFMRTPNTYYDSVVYSLGPDGGIANGNASDINGIRPAFCLKKGIPVTPYTLEEDAYTIRQ